ncbi:MAG TPA: radical SAM protein [Anaerolineae bacterium]|nr:radical SAM protein [Anaerolineae bacterium]
MRIALINPRFRLPIDTRTSPHLGLAYLAAVSQRRGDVVRVHDADVETEPLRQFVADFRPDIVGITANTPQVKQAWRSALAIGEVIDVPVVLGGPHVSVESEGLDFESLGQPGVHIVARGEGEATWAEVCNRLDAWKRDQEVHSTLQLFDPAVDYWKGLQGISYRTSDGALHRNPNRPPIADLDSLPWPAYDLFKMERYTSLQPATDAVEGSRSFSLMTSRGCPYRCTYCSQSVMPVRWRARSPEGVLDEWRHLVRDRGAQEIGVLDDSANIQVKRLEKLCDLLIAERLHHVPWIFVNGIRANLAERPFLSRLQEAGLKRLAFGVETGDPEMLKSIDKRTDLDTIRQAFRDAKAVGLETIGFFIIGLPGDTRETMQRTIDFAIELDPLIANFSMMTPYPGTKVFAQVKREGRLLIQDWEDYVFFEQKARFEMGDMTAELVETMYRRAYRQFYLRPKPILRRLSSKGFWLHLPRNARIALRTFLPKAEKTDLRAQIEADLRPHEAPRGDLQ